MGNERGSYKVGDGAKDIQKQQVVLVRRDTGEKTAVSETSASPFTKHAKRYSGNMFTQAKEFMQKNIREVKDFDEFKQIMDDKRSFIKTHWCKSLECERYVKEQTGATLRCIPFSKSLFQESA